MLIELTSEMAAATDEDYRPDPVKYPSEIDPRLLPFGTPAAAAVFEYGRRIGAERREHPRDDLVSRLVHAEVDGEHLDDPSTPTSSSCSSSPATRRPAPASRTGSSP